MIGRSMKKVEVKENDYLAKEEFVLSVKNLSYSNKFRNISFN